VNQFSGNILKMIFASIGSRGTSKKVYGPKVSGTYVRTCPGARHAWFQSRIGLIRKPLNIETLEPL